MKKKISSILYYLICIFVSAVFLFPFIVMVAGSLDAQDKYTVTLMNWFPKTFSLKQYKLVFSMQGQLIRWLINSILISVIPTITGVFLDTLIGYIFAKKVRYVDS